MEQDEIGRASFWVDDMGVRVYKHAVEGKKDLHLYGSNLSSTRGAFSYYCKIMKCRLSLLFALRNSPIGPHGAAKGA